MPFTFSHPAIIIPFFRTKKLSATGLIIGSMCPDFEYFFRMKVQSDISHTLLGLILFDLPVGLFVTLIFHEIIKINLIENLPVFFQSRLQILKNLKWIDSLKNIFFFISISILIGAISHLFWDSFTHESGYFVKRIPILFYEIHYIPFYKIVQHFSSLIGIITVLYYLYKLPIEKLPTKKPNLKYWGLVLCFILVFMSIRWSFGLSINQVGNVIVSLISSLILALTFAGLTFKNKEVI